MHWLSDREPVSRVDVGGDDNPPCHEFDKTSFNRNSCVVPVEPVEHIGDPDWGLDSSMEVVDDDVLLAVVSVPPSSSGFPKGIWSTPMSASGLPSTRSADKDEIIHLPGSRCTTERRQRLQAAGVADDSGGVQGGEGAHVSSSAHCCCDFVEVAARTLSSGFDAGEPRSGEASFELGAVHFALLHSSLHLLEVDASGAEDGLRLLEGLHCSEGDETLEVGCLLDTFFELEEDEFHVVGVVSHGTPKDDVLLGHRPVFLHDGVVERKNEATAAGVLHVGEIELCRLIKWPNEVGA